ncbi:MAG: hypothetical protein IJ744_02030 [Lachnospiraceae bacterium]|nr:hypothetical protein [Lachnospiraceae bacterium]
MKDQYIMQVRKMLSVSQKKKHEIIRDLEEIFASAREHEESDQEVIDRLGSPQDYVESIQAQLEIRPRSIKKNLLPVYIASFIGILFLVIFAISFIVRTKTKGIIGQAVSTTSIVLNTSLYSWLPIMLLALGIMIMIAVLIRIIKTTKKRV